MIGALTLLISFYGYADGIKSPIRKTCENPPAPVSRARDLINNCNSILYNHQSAETTTLAHNVIDILNRFKDDPEFRIEKDKELLLAIGKLTDAIDGSNVERFKPRNQLSNDIKELALNFQSQSSRAANPESYYKSIKQVISQTSQGERLINCFEKNPDKGIKGFEVKFINNNTRSPGNDQAAYLDYVTDKSDPQKRVNLVMNIDYRTNPIAAISMVAHEMQHACNGAKVCGPLKQCEEEEICDELDYTIMADELIGHKVESDVFDELALSAPEVMCNYNYVSSGKVQNLAEYMTSLYENYHSGDLIKQLAPSYIRAQLWPRDLVYKNVGGSVEINPKLSEAIKRAGDPDQKIK
ncbi:MAG: hypothetical protein K2P81_12230 [Bacteriovoracaceae bacterium]|nr:hypothetical protein [Bacteriovoracaceae bacterium]